MSENQPQGQSVTVDERFFARHFVVAAACFATATLALSWCYSFRATLSNSSLTAVGLSAGLLLSVFHNVGASGTAPSEYWYSSSRCKLPFRITAVLGTSRRISLTVAGKSLNFKKGHPAAQSTIPCRFLNDKPARLTPLNLRKSRREILILLLISALNHLRFSSTSNRF